MDDILDNNNNIQQKDPEGALSVVASQYEQTIFKAQVENPENDNRELTEVVVTGMGGSALAALLVKTLLRDDLALPFDIVRDYSLPAYVGPHTLVIASSYSGNTEETLSALGQAQERGAQVAVIASGGELMRRAQEHAIAHVTVPGGIQPRMATIYNLKALFAVLETFGLVSHEWTTRLDDLHDWLQSETSRWAPDVPTVDNYAKQLAFATAGKIPMFYGGPLTAALAYKYKISWNETAKNLAYWNEYPEFNHNEFLGWTSHPVEKPFAVFDLISPLERPRVVQRFELSDQLLSGKRPHAQTIMLQGDSLIAQLLWGAILADYASTYTALLNGVDPTPVVLIEHLKHELANNPR